MNVHASRPRTDPSGRNRHDEQHRVIVTVPPDFGRAQPMSGIQLARRSVFTMSGRPAPRGRREVTGFPGVPGHRA